MFNFLFKKNPPVTQSKISENSRNTLSSILTEEEMQAEKEAIKSANMDRNALPRDKDWLYAEIYNHVCWNHHGSGEVMAFYQQKIEEMYKEDMRPQEVEDIKKLLIGY